MGFPHQAGTRWSRLPAALVSRLDSQQTLQFFGADLSGVWASGPGARGCRPSGPAADVQDDAGRTGSSGQRGPWQGGLDSYCPAAWEPARSSAARRRCQPSGRGSFGATTPQTRPLTLPTPVPSYQGR